MEVPNMKMPMLWELLQIGSGTSIDDNGKVLLPSEQLGVYSKIHDDHGQMLSLKKPDANKA